ncbi:hypothetical protein LTS17_012182 [Exophiala oligosperma]
MTPETLQPTEGSNGDTRDAGPSLTGLEKEFLAGIPTRQLDSKVAVVTGAGSSGYSIGNGRAGAIMLAEAGANVICVDKDGESALRTVQLIKHLKLRGAGIASVADVTRESDCEEVIQLALDRFGRLDILVNNVGIHGSKGNSVTVDMSQWDTAMRVNVASMILMTKFAVPAMLIRGGDDGRVRGAAIGSIINIASVNGIRGGSPDILYPTTKGAIVNMTRAMATHHGPSGIRVNCVCPGWHVGSAIRFLASDEASWITGVVLPVDAGATVAVGFGHNMGH